MDPQVCQVSAREWGIIIMRTNSLPASRLKLCINRRSLRLYFPSHPRSNICRARAVLVQCSLAPEQPGESRERKPGWTQRLLRAARVFFGLIAVFVACDVMHFLGSRPPTDGQAWRNLAASEEDSSPGNAAQRRQPIIIYDRHKRIIAQFSSSAVIPLSEV